jgi:hypothetical protein
MQLIDITCSLDSVHGGINGRAIVNGARAAWNAARPWLGRVDGAVDTFGKYAGGALAAKEGYDLVRGGDAPAPASTPAPGAGQ